MKNFLRVIFAILTLGFAACSEPDYGSTPDSTVPSLGTPNDNEIWFTTVDGKELALDKNAFNVEIEHIDYSEYGICAIRFAGELTTIGERAFYGCRNIFNLSLPNSVTEIGERAFCECTNMESLTLGSGLRHCKNMAFGSCFSLRSLHIPTIQSWCRITFDSDSANPLYYACSLLINKTKVETLNIPEGTESISQYAFYNCADITRVNIPSSLKSIGRNAFTGCDYIREVIIRNVKKWSEIAFENQEANPLSISEKLYLKQKIDDEEVTTELSDIDLSGVAAVSAYAFINCTSIKSLMTDDTLTAIGDDAFRNCTSLTNATLGSSISEIGKHGFMNCKEMKSLTCYALQPPHLGNNDVFSYIYKDCKFYVPGSELLTYKDDEMWSKYANQIEGVN